MQQQRILIVDDDQSALKTLPRILKSHGVSALCSAVSTEKKARYEIDCNAPDVAILDLCLDHGRGPESGLELLQQVKQSNSVSRIIVLTGHAETSYGIRALELGASHFVAKPAEPAHIAALVRDSLEQARLRKELQRARTETAGQMLCDLVGSSASMARLRETLIRAAASPQPVLIVGETGTGKGLCARLIHLAGPGRSEAFVRYQPHFGNADMVQSELFGHVQGAFTGAERRRTGLIELAGNGTLFLDEIDSLPVETQILLLGVLEEREYRVVGQNKMQQVSCRFLCATNVDPQESLTSGVLRSDFFYRVAHQQIRIPPLRERIEDIPELATYVLQGVQEQGVRVYQCSNAALDTLARHTWPGNVRELEAVVESAAYAAHQEHCDVIEDKHLSLCSQQARENQDFHSKLSGYKRKLIQEALAASDGNQVQAARLLGIDRSTIRRVLHGS